MTTASDKVLKNRAFKTLKNPKCNGYQRRLANMVYKFFDTKKQIGSDSDGKGGSECK